MVRDKDTEVGIAGAVIEVDDIDHHIRSGAEKCAAYSRRQKTRLDFWPLGRFSLTSSSSAPSQLLAVTTGDC